MILRCLAKQPSERYASAIEVREGLKLVMKTLQFDAQVMPGEGAIRHACGSSGWICRLLKRRSAPQASCRCWRNGFRESGPANEKRGTNIVVLPFRNLGAAELQPFYGYALADALGARLAKMPSLVVRPSSALMKVPVQQLDPLSIGRKLLVDYVLDGSYLRSDNGFDLNWQLLDVQGQSVRTGGAISVESFDLIAVQTEICDEVFCGSCTGAGGPGGAGRPSLHRTH